MRAEHSVPMPWASRLTGRRAKAPSGLAKLASCASRPLTLAHHAVTQALKDELTGTFPGLRVIAKPMTRVNPGEEPRWKRGLLAHHLCRQFVWPRMVEAWGCPEPDSASAGAAWRRIWPT